MDPELLKLLQAYQASGPNPSSGIPNELYQYAQSNPSAGIDRSGQNLQQTDPMFNFYNPLQGQTPGQDWFATDDRNLPQQDPLQLDKQSVSTEDNWASNLLQGARPAPFNNTQSIPQTAFPAYAPAGPMTGGTQALPTTGGAPALGGAPGPLPVYGGTPANYTPQPNTGGGITPGPTMDSPNGPIQVGPNNAEVALTPAPPQIPNQFSGAFSGDYNNYMNNIASQMQGIYNYQTPQAAAAQTQLGMVPQGHAQQVGTSPELAQLLSGMGLDPATLARMHTTVGERYASSGAQQQSQAKRSLAQAGLSTSPAGAAIQSDIARNNMGEANTAQNEVDIQNALLGNSNKLAGVGFQTNIGLSNMGQANQMALENMNKMFAAMQQNTANQQQTNLSNTGAQQNQQLASANQTTGFLGNQANAFGNASLNRNINADTNNANNMINWNQGNQAATNNMNQFNLNNQQNYRNGTLGANNSLSAGNYTA